MYTDPDPGYRTGFFLLLLFSIPNTVLERALKFVILLNKVIEKNRKEGK